jgi:hypothetical protein
MSTIHPNAAGRKCADDVEPLTVRPNVAMRLLDCSRASLYELINSRQIDSYLDGNARRITTRSIHALVDRKVREAQAQPA